MKQILIIGISTMILFSCNHTENKNKNTNTNKQETNASVNTTIPLELPKSLESQRHELEQTLLSPQMRSGECWRVLRTVSMALETLNGHSLAIDPIQSLNGFIIVHLYFKDLIIKFTRLCIVT